MERIENRMVVDSEWSWKESKPSIICECENEIYPGEEYWNINGEIYCKKCLRDFRKVAE